MHDRRALLKKRRFLGKSQGSWSIVLHSDTLFTLLICPKVPYSSRIRRRGAETVERVKPTSSCQIPSPFVGSYSYWYLQFWSKRGGGEPGRGKEAEQPSVTGPAWPQGSWEGVYLNIHVGSSSIPLWLQSRAN